MHNKHQSIDGKKKLHAIKVYVCVFVAIYLQNQQVFLQPPRKTHKADVIADNHK